ncbi:hypothetical protein Q31a_05080 [Aureliella helgolandensis]|uniref:Uncharacterized protein n=1 Tax=Aureliella helgolandensis TaxID=2527968 RepID=A0A518G129_9BACT|nr:hypothetical protein Q31a_05080 [Aureliella helgolandensis]
MRLSLADYFTMTALVAYSMHIALQPTFGMFVVLTIPMPVVIGLYLRNFKSWPHEHSCCGILSFTFWGSVLFFGVASYVEIFSGRSNFYFVGEEWGNVVETSIFGLFYSGFAGVTNICIYSVLDCYVPHCAGRSQTDNQG